MGFAMKAMVLAAGRGERMSPLTDELPKPLLEVGGKPLLEWHVEKLVAAGFSHLVVNVCYFAHLIEAFLGDGSRWGCEIRYSREEEPLETAGGILHALPLLGVEPFALLNGDIWTDYDLQNLHQVDLPAQGLAHLILVDNPPQHRRGDFHLDDEGVVVAWQRERSPDTLTYAGMGVYHPDLFAETAPGRLPLLSVFERYIPQGLISGQHYRGEWQDVGTPQRLQALDGRLRET